MRLWSGSVSSSLTLHLFTLSAEFRVEAVISIQLSPRAPENMGRSFSLTVRSPFCVKNCTSVLPLASMTGLYHELCLQLESRPHIRFAGFAVFRKCSMGTSSWARVL